MKTKLFFKLITAAFLLSTLVSCQSENKNSDPRYYAKVTITIDQIDRTNSRLEATTGSIGSSLISVVEGSTSSVNSSTNLSGAIDRQLLQADGSVTLTVPLSTEIRLVKVNYRSEFTRSQIIANNPVPIAMGLSDGFTIEADTVEKSVEITVTDIVAVASTIPADASTDIQITSDISVLFNHGMDATTLTTNEGTTDCSGSLQLSTSTINFESCVALDATVDATSDNQKFTVTPSSSLDFGTTYKIRATTAAQNTSGIALESAYTSTTGFTTVIDSPTVTSTIPADGTTDVNPGAEIVVVFSQEMDITTITDNTADTSCSGSFQLSSDDFSTCVQTSATKSNANSNVVYNEGHTMFGVSPNSILDLDTLYKIRVTTDAKNASGLALAETYTSTTGFTTGSTAPPTVSSTNPADGSTDVSVGTSISVTFDMAMDTSAMSTASGSTGCDNHFRVSADNFTTCVAMDVQPVASNDNQTFTVTPTADLSADTTYKIQISSDVRSADLLEMGQHYTSTTGFTTGSAAPVAPTVSSTTPADEATAVAIDTTIAITFSQAMATTGISVGTTSSCGGNIQVSLNNFSTCVAMSSITPTYSNSNQTLTVTPAADLATSSTYKIRVTADTQNASGTELGQAYTSPNGFTTAAPSAQLIGGTMQGIDLNLSTDAGVVTHFAGLASTTGTTDAPSGPATDARFNYPYGITTDGTNLYVADRDNHIIRKIVIASGVVTTIAGTGVAGNVDHTTGTSAQFNTPSAITTDGTNLYVADTTNHSIRQISLTSPYAVTPLAGTGAAGYNDNVAGASAQFNNPYGITVYGGNLYVADRDNHAIRRISLTSPYNVLIIAGTDSAGGSGSTDANGTAASFNMPTSVTISTDGSKLYVTDMVNSKIRSVLVASPNTVASLPASLYYPRGITTDGTNLYVANTDDANIQKIVISTDTLTRLAGLNNANTGCTVGTGTVARFNIPKGIVSDGTYLYVAVGNCHVIAKIAP